MEVVFMKKNTLKSLLFDRIVVVMIVISLVLIIAVILSVTILFRNVYNSTIDHTISFINQYFNEGVKSLDFISDKSRDSIEGLLSEVYKAYSKDNFLEEYKKLKRIYLEKRYFKDINYYIISNEGKIEATDYLKDLGMNLSQRVPKYWNKLKEELGEKGEYIELLSFEIKTNSPRMYGYKLLSDGKILEVGVLINENAFSNVFKNVQSIKFNFIEGIYTYNVSYVPFSPQSPLLEENEKKIFEGLEFSKGKIKEYDIIEQSNGERVSIYLKWQPENKYNFSILSKIVIDFSNLTHVKRNLIFITIILISMFIFIFLIYIKKNTDGVEKPLLDLIRNIEKGKIEVTESGIIEIDTLIKYYSHMVSNLVDKVQSENDELMSVKSKLETIEKEKEVLFDMALKDNLTKLFNKKGAENVLRKLINDGEKFILICINIDNYQSILNKYGQTIANNMILSLLDIIKQTTRSRDFILRTDEDKFMIVLRYINFEISQRVLKRIVDFVKKFNITSGREYKISISYGLLEYRNQELEEIFVEAEKRIEEMKKKKMKLLKKIKENGK